MGDGAPIWPTWRGDAQRSGRSRFAGPRTPARLLWTVADFTADAVDASGALIGSGWRDTNVVAGLAAPSGHPLYRVSVDPSYLGRPSVPSLTADSTAWFGSREGGEDAGQLWAGDGRRGVRGIQHFLSDCDISDPLTNRDRIYFWCGRVNVRPGEPYGTFRSLRSDGSGAWATPPGRLLGNLAIGRDGSLLVIGPTLYALDPDSGQVRWQRTADLDFLFGGAVAPDGDVCFLGERRIPVGNQSPLWLWCGRGSDGVQHFAVPVPPEVIPDGGPRQAWFAIAADGTFLLAREHQLLALDADGRRRWALDFPDAFFASDPVVDTDGTTYLLVLAWDAQHGAGARSLAAVTPAGALSWKVDAPRGGGDLFVGPQRTIYIAGSSETALYGE